jgi:hypothetical protein
LGAGAAAHAWVFFSRADFDLETAKLDRFKRVPTGKMKVQSINRQKPFVDFATL